RKLCLVVPVARACYDLRIRLFTWEVIMTRKPGVLPLAITGACIALCVVLPLAFHAIPNAGNVFSPMHIPVLLCGLICGWPFGLACGILGPLLSSLITGMPPQAFLLPMAVELAVYGLATGFLMRWVHTGSNYADLYICLIAAMLLGRVIAGLARGLILSPGNLTMAAWASGYFITSLPGIAIHLALIPALVMALMRARLIPARYPGRA
ncbi:MAG: ECF transporter S component, partial [Eubacteriales bacterium]|nr:ECF transporter S component [Eubacteriales bacterium]